MINNLGSFFARISFPILVGLYSYSLSFALSGIFIFIDVLLLVYYRKILSQCGTNPDFSPLNIGGPVGVIIFTGLPVPEIAKGAFGLERNEQQGLFELSRLCIHPDIQSGEHNITSWFVSRAIRQLRKDTEVKAIISYADSDFHNGTIYRACNFKYCGLTDAKKDFYYADGTKHSRGKIKGAAGEWKERSRKHRYVMVFDKNLKLLW